MGVINRAKYGRLLLKVQPKLIENDEEFDRFVRVLEQLTFAKHELTPEEKALDALLSALIQEYDDRVHTLPDVDPAGTLRFLMEQRGLRQRDLLPVFGSRSVTSDVLNGKRSISKTHAHRLADYFKMPVSVFI